MGLVKEFKEFALKGNMVDLAVGVIIGAAFGGVVKSLVDDVMMPPLGMLMGGVDFSNKVVTLSHGEWDVAKNAWIHPPTILSYGKFINTLINFLIVAMAVFAVVKMMNMAKRKPNASPDAPTTKECPRCTSTIPIAANKCPQCTADI